MIAAVCTDWFRCLLRFETGAAESPFYHAERSRAGRSPYVRFRSRKRKAQARVLPRQTGERQ
jgi:hypothetical protein